jgi:hypothetical protein
VNQSNTEVFSLRELNRLARKIQSIFEAKKSTKRKIYKSAKKFEGCWIKAAEVVNRLKANPEAYLDAQFKIPNGNLDGGTPFPNQIYNDLAVRKYLLYIKKQRPSYEKLVNNQVAYLSLLQEQNPEKDTDDFLLDPRTPLKNFTRVILCSEDVYKDIFEMYGTEARKELEFEPGLDEYLRTNYGTRYKRIYPERVSKSHSGSHTKNQRVLGETLRRQNHTERFQQPSPQGNSSSS